MEQKQWSLPLTDKQLKQLLLEQLKRKPQPRRKELIERCIARIALTPAQRRDKQVDSLLTQLKSRLGTQLTALQREQLVEEGDEHRLHLKQDSPSLADWDAVSSFVLRLLEGQSSLQKQDIFRRAEQYFGTDRTPEKQDDYQLHSLLGRVLQQLEQEHRICQEAQGVYTLPIRQGLPNTELGFYLSQAREGADLRLCFLRAIHVKGGEWFESYAVQLMKRYYERTGKNVAQASVTGGSNDGGIDGVILTTDSLGFREQIFLQMKNKNAPIPAKEIREFYGAVCAEKGSRGLFITISDFHSEAEKLISRIDNLVGINGEKLFSIACLCGYGIIVQQGRRQLDEAVFMDRPEKTE